MAAKQEPAIPDRKKQILDAATILFAENGYYKTTTAQVAKAIGVTQPYIFHFFKSKEELFLGIITRAVDQIYETFKNVQAPRGQLFEAMGHAFNRLIETNRDELLLAMQSFSTPEIVIRDFARERFALIYRTIRDRLGEDGHPNPNVGASKFIGMGLVITLSEVLSLPELSPFCNHPE